MRRTGHRLPAVAAVIGFGLVLFVAAPRAVSFASTAAPLPTAPAPVACGTPVSAWGPAIAGDVLVALLQTASSSGSATPAASDQVVFAAEIEVENRAERSVSVLPSEITLTLCDRRVLSATADTTRLAFTSAEIAPDDTRTGWIVFSLEEGAVPALLTIPISRPDLTGSRVEFRLVTDSATPGAGVVGGDAVGGDGADGTDATGGSSVSATCQNGSDQDDC